MGATPKFGQPVDILIVEQVARIAAERQVPRAQVALAWMASRAGVTAPIIGATKPHHIDDAVAALDLHSGPLDENVPTTPEAVYASPRTSRRRWRASIAGGFRIRR